MKSLVTILVLLFASGLTDRKVRDLRYLKIPDTVSDYPDECNYPCHQITFTFGIKSGEECPKAEDIDIDHDVADYIRKIDSCAQSVSF